MLKNHHNFNISLFKTCPREEPVAAHVTRGMLHIHKTPSVPPISKLYQSVSHTLKDSETLL